MNKKHIYKYRPCLSDLCELLEIIQRAFKKALYRCITGTATRQGHLRQTRKTSSGTTTTKEATAGLGEYLPETIKFIVFNYDVC